MKTKRKTVGIVLAVFLTWILAFCGIFGGTAKKSAFALEGVTFEANDIKTTYVLGDELSVPQGSFYYGGKAYPAESVVYYPSGNAYNVLEADLDETGKYTVEYRAIINDQLVKEKREFTVLKSLYSTSSPLSKIEYGSPVELGIPFADEKSPTGLHVSLVPGDTFNYNGVVDLSKSSRDNKTFQFYLTPQREGAADVYAIYVKFTDIYDPNNYAIVSMYSYNSKDLSSNATRASYVTACVPSIGQSYTGHYTTLQPQNATGAWRDTIFKSMRTSGFCSFMSFYGNNGNDEIYFVDANGNRLPDDAAKSQIADFVVEERGYLGQHQMDFWWNYEEKSVLSHQPLEFVKEAVQFPPNYGQDWTDTIADFDNPNFYGTLWEGFTTGECYVSMWAEDYSNSTCDFVVTTLDGFDLTQGEPPATYEDTAAPAISVNYGKYTESTYPQAKVGCAYPVFNATAMDGNDGETEVSSRAYYGYGTEDQYEVTCTDVFTPDRVGEFTIVYTAMDKVGNQTTEEVVVTVALDATELIFDLNTEDAVKTGVQSTFVSTPEPAYSGGVGDLTYSVVATHKQSGTQYVGENNAFRPMEVGTYEVVCTVKDYIGQTKQVSYEVEVTAATGPIFETLPTLPRYFIGEYYYRLPALTATDANGNAVSAEIYVLDGGERTLLEGGLYYTTGETRIVSVIYSAGSGDDVTELVFDIPLVEVLTSNRIDLSKYFYGDGFTAAATNDSSTLTVNAGETSATLNFINPLLAEGYNAEFKISKGEFRELSMILTDSVNSKESIKLSWKNESGVAFMYVNGIKSTLSTMLDFAGENASSFAWNNATHTFSDNTSQLSLVIQETVYGEAFNGFSSGKIYVTFEMTGVTGDAELTFYNINGQIIRKNLRTDNTGPMLTLLDSYAPRAYVGEKIDIKSYVAADVISPDVSVSIKVLDPDGQEVEVKNGLFTVAKAGEYKVQYILNDGNNESTVQYIITGRYENQIDILINGSLAAECKVGDKITPPKAIYTSVSGSVTGTMLVIDPAGMIVNITAAGSFTASQAGTYVIVYYGVDVSGNTRTVTLTIVAK